MRSIVLSTVLAVTAGCGGHAAEPDAGADAGDGLPTPALSPADACARLAAALASVEVRCGRLAASDQARYAASLCTGWVDAEQAAWDAGRFAYSAQAVSCAVSFRAAEPCNLSTRTLTGCEPLAWGTLATGDPCGDDLACAFGDYCYRQAPGDSCGTCAPDPSTGGACGPAASNAPCASGICDGEQCQVEAGVNGFCNTLIGGGGAVCQPGLACLDGNCRSPGAAAARCVTSSDCQDGLYCSSEGACAARPLQGAPCPDGVCGFGLVCTYGPDGGPGDGGADAGEPTCAKLVAGGPCVADLSGQPDCLEGEWCDGDGGCLPRPALGESCSARSPCLAGVCDAGTCGELPAGAACQFAQDCESQLCGGESLTPVCGGACSGP